MVTVYQNIFAKEPVYVSVLEALEWIRTGRSRERIEQVRSVLSKDKANSLKKQLPCVLFSGKFGVDPTGQTYRTDALLVEHSGFLVLDFDELGDEVREWQTELINWPYCYACWVSPRGNGLKVLVRIADGSKHREHFAALKKFFPEVDGSGVNLSRVCYESYDPEIWINEQAQVWTEYIEEKGAEMVRERVMDDTEAFNNLLTWLTNRNDAFVTGSRHMFLFKLASACCRFGIEYSVAESLILHRFYSQSSECRIENFRAAIRGGYKASRDRFGTACFERERLVERSERTREVKLDIEGEEDFRLKDVVYGADVKVDALAIYREGYSAVQPLGVPDLDQHFKMKRGELTCLTGIGNYGKSSFKKWYEVCRAVVFGEKFATFAPEDNPPHEYYHDLVEIILGANCTPSNPNRPSAEEYENAYDFISQHFFYLQPKDEAPTPQYIKERFLEIIVKEGVSGVSIDPFNQMVHDYGRFGGKTDKYLEWLFFDLAHFAQVNDVYFWIVAHPTGSKVEKGPDGNYKCPDVFDIADGGMWNNKMDNILVFHRPFAQTGVGRPDENQCEFHSKKIRRQKVVGVRGWFPFEMIRARRRFYVGSIDYLQKFLSERGLDFRHRQGSLFDDRKAA